MIDLVGRGNALSGSIARQRPGETWDRADLIRRVRQALDIAGRAAIAAVVHDPLREPFARQNSNRDANTSVLGIQSLVLRKVVAEATMLLRVAAYLGETDATIAPIIDELAHQLAPHARGKSLMVAMCREPTLALDHAAAHIHLRDLGYKDEQIDRLLHEILKCERLGGAERLPNHDLERRWLKHIWSGAESDILSDADAELLTRTCIARPLDGIGSTTVDLYAFTHVVLYATDMGRRSIKWPRSPDGIIADAEAGLAAALDADNFDLAAELLWTWPMLDRPWSQTATFGFGILAATQDAHGFLPGPGYSAQDSAQLSDDLQHDYVLRTSYHTTLVMGILCAVALRSSRAPPLAVAPTVTLECAIELILPLIRTQSREPRWQSVFPHLSITCRESLAEFVLTIALRRANASHDLEMVRECLRIGMRCTLLDGPAVHQALALLRRVTMLGRISNDECSAGLAQSALTQ